MQKDIELEMRDGKMDSLRFKEFTFDMFVEHPAICLIAKRASGKSWIIRALVHYYKFYPCGIVICPSEKNNVFYGNFFPDSYIHYKYDSDVIERLLKRQYIITKKCEKRISEGRKPIDPRTIIVMDDCLASKGAWANDETTKNLLFNGRHFKMTYILSLQFALGITPDLRSNFDYIFLLAEDFISNQKRIYEHYAGMFPTFDSFRQVFSKLTSDNGAMVIANRGPRGSLFEKIFWYKAPDLTDVGLQFGSKQFRDYHDRNYNKNWMDEEMKFDVDDYINKSKKNKKRIHVAKINKSES